MIRGGSSKDKIGVTPEYHDLFLSFIPGDVGFVGKVVKSLESHGVTVSPYTLDALPEKKNLVATRSSTTDRLKIFGPRKSKDKDREKEDKDKEKTMKDDKKDKKEKEKEKEKEKTMKDDKEKKGKEDKKSTDKATMASSSSSSSAPASSSSSSRDADAWKVAITKSHVFAFVMTPESLLDQKCVDQIFFAYEANKLIIPCILRDPWSQLRGAVKMMFQAIVWVDFTKNSFPVSVGLIAEQVHRLKSSHDGAVLPAHLTRFLANMTHELRNPMSAILGISNILGDDPQLSAHQALLVETIRSSAESLLVTLGSVLDMTKLESCVLQLTLSTFDLFQVATEALRLYSFRAFQQSIELGLLMDKTCPRFIHGDRERLKQIVANLVSNSIKFTDKGQVILVISRRSTEAPKSDGDDCKFTLDFTIIDSGVGMKKEDSIFLFRRFRQVSYSSSSTYFSFFSLLILIP